ncbi:MAG TPA: tetratricopeptide repeat protein [Verrucomicrobiae bacterium]|jgi:tetratricopeptide (TPR) repeat protein|nr:tetratricopeptide repeat protein [Verrucomicrobiae bacterium]
MIRKSMFVSTAALLLALCAVPAWSQATLASVTGKVTDGSKPLVGAKVVITNNDSGRQYSMKTDKKGEFEQIGFTRSTNYTLEVFNADGQSVFKRSVAITNERGEKDNFLIDISNPDATNLGMNSQGTGGHKQTKEEAAQTAKQKQELEAIKEKNKKAESENTLIAQLNPAMQSQNWTAAEPLLLQLIEINPARWEYVQALGNAQFSQGKYDDAVASYEKGVSVAQNTTDPKADAAKIKAGLGQMLTNEGNAYLKLKKNPEAIAAYNKAAELSSNPGVAYFNICATQYNTGNMEGAVTACDKAIAADPNKADAYFIKGSSLYGNGKLDAQNKYVVPPGTAEALNKYLELAPDGTHAADVKAMLEAVGAKIETTYKERKKK